MDRYDVIIRPVITEKSDAMSELFNQYVFEVDTRANKLQVKDAVESIFEVDVTEVRTMVVPGKSKRWGRRMRRLPSWKKAIVTLAEGDSIDLVG